MGIYCDCSVDCDEPVDVQVETYPRARVRHVCCECNAVIEPGQFYERTFTVLDGDVNTHKTCMPCVRIRRDYCPHGYIWGDLAEHIRSCLGFDYREDPSSWSQEEMDKQDEEHQAAALRRGPGTRIPPEVLP